MQDLNSNLADGSFQLRVSRKTLATLAKFFHKRGHTPVSKSELGRISLEALKHILVVNFNASEFTDSAEATRFLESIGLTSLSVRGREAAYMKQLQKEVAVEGGVLTFDPFEERAKVSKVNLEEGEQTRIDQLVDQFEEGE